MESSTFGRDTAWAMSQENVEIVRGLQEAFARGDNDTPFSVYDPEIEWDMTRLPLPGEESVYHGHDGVRRYWRAWLEAWEFIDAPIERFVEAGDNVVTLFGPMTGRGKKSGVEVEFPPGRRSGHCATERWSACGSIRTTPKPSKPPGCGSRG